MFITRIYFLTSDKKFQIFIKNGCIILKNHIDCIITTNNIKYCYIKERGDNMKKYEKLSCPECGKEVDSKSYTMECDYCLSKKED